MRILAASMVYVLSGIHLSGVLQHEFSTVIRRLHIRANLNTPYGRIRIFLHIISVLSYVQPIQLKVLMYATYSEQATLCSDEACANIIVLLLFLSSVKTIRLFKCANAMCSDREGFLLRQI